MIQLKIAFRNMLRHKSRSIITLSAIAFGSISLIFVGGFFEDIFFKMRESYIQAHTGHLQVFRKGFFDEGSARPFDYLIQKPEEVISDIKSIPGVKFVAARVGFSGLISTGENTASFIGQGVEPAKERAVLLSDVSKLIQTSNKDADKTGEFIACVIEDGLPLRQEDRYEVVLGKGLAAGLGVKSSDSVILVTNTVEGSINAVDVIVRGIFVTSSKQFDDHFLRLPLPIAQKLLHTDSVQSLVIMLKRTEDTMKVKKEIERLARRKKLDLELKSWDELTDFYAKTVDLFGKQFLILKIVIATIVILSIFNTMNMAVLERTAEIGTIMALGTKRRSVLMLFLWEGLGLGMIGGVTGIALGAMAVSLVSHVGIPMPPPPGSSIQWLSQPKIVPSVLVFSFALSLITSLISSLYPAHKASRLEIAEALRRV